MEELKLIKEHLKYGDRIEIAKTFKVSRALVYAVLAGERKNNEILQEAIKIALKNKEDQELISSEVKKLMD